MFLYESHSTTHPSLNYDDLCAYYAQNIDVIVVQAVIVILSQSTINMLIPYSHVWLTYALYLVIPSIYARLLDMYINYKKFN